MAGLAKDEIGNLMRDDRNSPRIKLHILLYDGQSWIILQIADCFFAYGDKINFLLCFMIWISKKEIFSKYKKRVVLKLPHNPR